MRSGDRGEEDWNEVERSEQRERNVASVMLVRAGNLMRALLIPTGRLSVNRLTPDQHYPHIIDRVVSGKTRRPIG